MARRTWTTAPMIKLVRNAPLMMKAAFVSAEFPPSGVGPPPTYLFQEMTNSVKMQKMSDLVSDQVRYRRH
ncbi:hypothetical protein BDZ97DRAFT_1783172 [Flammula alnicola]|nr:hypothetical protein BDZ97DRAFT_1783172 [Flammula alnicola]